MGVDDLARDALTDAHVARDTAICGRGRGDGEMVRLIGMASDAERFLLHDTEAESMLIEVTRGAQAATQLARHRVPDELPCAGGARGEAASAQHVARGTVAVERVLNAGREVFARHRLLKLRLVAAGTCCVPNGRREVGMGASRVTLPAPDAQGRMQALGVPLANPRVVAALAALDVDRGTRDRLGSRTVGGPGREEAAAEQGREHEHEPAKTHGAADAVSVLRGEKSRVAADPRPR